MYTALDINNYLVSRIGEQGTKTKRQKLLYFAQAWHLAWYGAPLFVDEIRAWENGPVVESVWRNHRTENSESIDQPTINHMQAILDYYGDMTGSRLSDLTHEQDPWVQAYQNGTGKNSIISQDSMFGFYSLQAEGPIRPETTELKEISDDEFLTALEEINERLAGVDAILMDR